MKETTKIEYEDTLVSFKVHIPAKTIKFEGNIAGQAKLVFLPGKEKRIEIFKETKDASVKTTIDSIGNITQEVICKEDSLLAEVKLRNKKITTLIEIKKEYEKREGFFQKVIRYLIGFVSLIIIIAVVLLVLYAKIRKKLPIP